MKSFSRKIKMIVALLAAIIFSGTTLTYAYAESFTVASVSADYNYKEVTGSSGSSFQTNVFSVKDANGNAYNALCVLPKKNSPPVNATYTSGEWTYDCRRTRIYFYGLGSGASSGPLSGYNYNQRVILTHACLAYEGGDPDWNGGSWNLLGQAGASGYDAVMSLYNYAGNNGLPDGYSAATIYLTADGSDSPYQNLVAYWEDYTEPRGWIELHKSSSNAAVTNNNSNYSLEGAVYGIYSDSELKNLVTTIKTDASGLAVSTWLSKGTYYIREWSAGKGYDVDITTHTVSVTVSNKATDVYVTEVPQKGAIQLHKYSTLPAVSENNNCYSLNGAVYGVYTDYACTKLYTQMTTDSNGNASVSDLTYGTYYVKEISASKGFELSNEVFTCNINSTTAVKVDAPETPGNDPISLVLSKRTADGHGSGNTRLEGAEYTVKYYDTLSDTDPAQSGSTAKYTWVFKTDANGRISLRPDYLLSGSDGLIANSNGTLYVLPLGTITIQETKAPEGYLINDTVYVAQTILSNGIVRTTNLPTDDKAAQETPYEGTISIQKFLGGSNAVKASEPDAEFQIYLKSAGSYEASPEESRQTITTDANGYAVTKRLPYGTYTIHQTKGNNKYYFIDDIDVTISENNANYHKILENIPIEFYLKMVKKDADTGNTVNVAGATFELYDENGAKVSFKTMTSSGIKTIDSFTTDENGCVYTVEKLLKGSYTLVETKAPEGYVLDSTPVSFTVSENTYTEDGGAEIVVVEKADKAVTGQLTVTKAGEVLDKWDATTADSNNHFVYKKANIPGASFTLTAKEDIKTADNSGYAYRAGDVVAEFTTGADGSSVIDSLPLGSYVLTETKAPAGFVIDTDPVDVTFTYAGQTVDIVKDSKTVEDERQKIAVDANKTDAATMNPLLNTVFALYADEDIVNHDGAVIIKKGAMIERQTTNALGKAVFVSDLPLGHYIVKEIDSPTGYGNRFEFKTIDAAYKSQTTRVQSFSYFFEDDHTEVVRTQATDTATGTHQGALSADNKYVVYDHVECDNLFPGKTYTLKGALTDKDTGKTLKDINGNDVTDSVTFKATGVKQTVTVTFSFEAELAGKTLVAYENMFQDGKMIYTHADIDDTEQTIYYPEIHTTATDKASQTHTGTVDEQTTVIDKVDYKNLIPGSTYEVSGVLMNKETGAALLDKDGKEITAKTTFKAEKASGSVELAFTFDSTLLIGKSIVAFEDLYNENIRVAFHTDIKDEGQTVHYPEIHTTATDAATKTHTAAPDSKTTIIDKVDYKNLVPGESYEVSGIIMDKTTGEALTDKNGNTITSKTSFKAEKADGSVDVAFTFDSTLLEDKSVVVYEDLYSGNAKVASHADITDEGQTVNFPKIHTTATDKNTSTHTGMIAEKTTITDKVDYSNLTVGEKYKVSGVLMNQETGKKLLDKEGKEITSEKEFTAESKNGSIDIEFTFDSSLLAGKTIVVFEDLYSNDVKVAVHADIKDEGQTVHYPEIHTTATDNATKTHTAAPDSKTIITDKVDYKNLVVGNTYEVSGVLMDKSTGKALLDKEKKEITATKKFTAEKPDGTVELEFTFDSTLLKDKSVVVFEDLYNEDIRVAFHTDIKDEGQTVNFPEIHTTATDKATKSHTGVVDEKTTIIDKVAYSNLTVGEKYKVSGVLMNQETGKKLLDKEGKEITSEKEFTAESKNGSIDIEFTFDSSLLAGKTTVVFEDLYNEKIRVASHADIKDEEQSVHFPDIHTTATIDSAKSITEKGSVILKDVVDYKNLIAGKTYEVKGVLMNQETGEKFLDKDGNEITGSASFTAEKADGSVDVTFTFDSSLLAGNTIVVFENLYENNVKVIGHADINDVNQTVEIVKTGDTSNAYIYALIALISLAVMVSLVMIKKSRNHN